MSLQELRETFKENHHAVKLYLGQEYKKIDNGKDEQNHPADLRRMNQFIKNKLEEIVDIPVKEKRELTANEQKAFDGLMAVSAINEKYIQIQAEADTIFQSAYGLHNTEGKRLYNQGEKLALNTRPENLQGVHLGHVMAAMAGGTRSEQVRNALSEGTDSAGGYTAPIEIMREFVDLLRTKSVMFAAGAKTLLIESKKSNIATVLVDPVATWRAENAAVSEADLTLGNVAFNPRSLAVIVRVSRELLQDSLNIQEILINSIAQGLATQLDYAGLYGQGVGANQPLGLDSQLITAARTTALATNGAKLSASGNYKQILAAANQVAANNDQANAIVLAPRTKYDLAALADTTGQPLEVPQIIADMQMLDTSAVPVNLVVGTSGSVCSEVFVGNFTNMMLGMRQELRIEVLNERYADVHQIGFKAHLRADWAVARINSFWKVRGILAE